MGHHALTAQEKIWGGKFGATYIGRNYLNLSDVKKLYRDLYKMDVVKLNQAFIGQLPRSTKILEVGCNIGMQLALLGKMGFTNLYGVEINQAAVKTCRTINPSINIVQGSALDIPFKDSWFDLVFTAGVLIHISPRNIKQVMTEIYRCTRTYIWGFEYFAKKYTAIRYRSNRNMLWKADFARLYLKQFSDLCLVKEKMVPYVADRNTDTMFLLKKNRF